MNHKNLELLIQEKIELAPLTTLKVGGAARFFVRAQSVNEVIEAVRWSAERKLPLFVLGGGSNVLINDSGYDGMVLQIGLKGIEVDGNRITVQAGEDWDEFVNYCVELNLQGIECLSGIPGLVGGTPVQNVGAYGQEVSETIESVCVLDRQSLQRRKLSNSDCQFEYRTSIFNTTRIGRFIVLSVTFRLNQDGEPSLIYKDLRDYFGDRKPSLSETRRAVCQIRAEKAMLVRQGGLDSQSAGSFFKNPIVSKEKLAEMYTTFGGQIPHYEANADQVKVPAAWLIERSGFEKGYVKGKAGLSTKHTLALTNRGNANAGDILKLKDEIQAKVYQTFRVELIPEPVFVGFGQNDVDAQP